MTLLLSFFEALMKIDLTVNNYSTDYYIFYLTEDLNLWLLTVIIRTNLYIKKTFKVYLLYD